jgi:hypothetical protein
LLRCGITLSRIAMPGSRQKARASAAQAPRPDGQAASARTATPKKAGNGAPQGAPRPEEPRAGAWSRRAERGASARPEPALRGLLRGLRAGDLETILLTVAMAADENLMPSADPDEVARILGFLARLAQYDPALLPGPIDAGAGPEGQSDALTPTATRSRDARRR